MSDLVQRLRARQRVTTSNSTGESGYNQIITTDPLCQEAADEIERLTQALKKANDQAEHFEREGWIRRQRLSWVRAIAQPTTF